LSSVISASAIVASSSVEEAVDGENFITRLSSKVVGTAGATGALAPAMLKPRGVNVSFRPPQ